MRYRTWKHLTNGTGEHSLSGYIGFMDLICVSALMLQFPDGPVSYVCGIWWRSRPRWHINLCRGCKHTRWYILWAKVPRMQTVGMDGQNTETERIASNSFASFLLFRPLLFLTAKIWVFLQLHKTSTVLLPDSERAIYSVYFLLSKKAGDLHHLNNFIACKPFCMLTNKQLLVFI